MSAAPQLVALLDGTLHDATAPLLRADDLGVVRGDGVFDVAYGRDGAIADLETHLDRLAASARILSLPEPDRDGYRRAVNTLVAAWSWAAEPEAIVRMVLTRGPESGGEPSAWAMMQPVTVRVKQERDGVRVVLLDRGFEADETVSLPWLLPGAKSLSYGVNMAAKRWALAHGADDALFVTPRGRLLDGPTSSLVLDLDGEFVTPHQDGLLPSTTVRRLAALTPVRYEVLGVEALKDARGGWLLSSGRILAPITAVDGRDMPRSSRHDELRTLLNVPGTR